MPGCTWEMAKALFSVCLSISCYWLNLHHHDPDQDTIVAINKNKIVIILNNVHMTLKG